MVTGSPVAAVATAKGSTEGTELVLGARRRPLGVVAVSVSTVLFLILLVFLVAAAASPSSSLVAVVTTLVAAALVSAAAAAAAAATVMVRSSGLVSRR